VFFAVALIAACCYVERKRQLKIQVARTAEATKSAIHAALADPMLVAGGIQIIRAIGIKKRLPVLAIGGVVLGLLVVSRRDAPGQTPTE
jgi:hypothetical protein